MTAAFTPKTIQAGFRAAGIHPFNPAAISRDKLLPAQASDSASGSSSIPASGSSISASGSSIPASGSSSNNSTISELLTLPHIQSKYF